MRVILLLVILVFPSFVFAAVSHPNSETVTACYTEHDDVHFFPISGICEDDYDYGYVLTRGGADCEFYSDLEVLAPAQVIDAGVSHCLVEDNAGNLWSIEKGLDSEAGISACTSADEFSGNSGCADDAAATPVPVMSAYGLGATILGLILVAFRRFGRRG